MKCFVLVLALSSTACLASIVPGYPSPPQEYGQEEQGGGYGKPKCTYYDETVTRDHCEKYTERLCHTTHKESCQDINDQNCKGVVSSKQVRKCFDVTELKCSLKEEIKHETIQVPITVQKCRKGYENICDTVYDAAAARKEKFLCITVKNPKCSTSQNTIYDRTCRTTATFECDTSYGQPAYPAGGNSGNAGSGDAYGQGDAYGSDNQYSSQSGYGLPKPYCKKSVDTKCYKTPRTVSVQNCASQPEKVCETLSEKVPNVRARQVCRKEEKKVCSLAKSSQPKQIQRFVYSKACRSVPRQVCDNADIKTLVPSCVPTTRKKCTYTPQESCEDIPKQQCFKLAYKIRKQKCEPAYPAGESYGEEPAPSYGGEEQQGYPEPTEGY